MLFSLFLNIFSPAICELRMTNHGFDAVFFFEEILNTSSAVV